MLVRMRCPTCGTENAPDSRFCGGCGARLEPSRVAPTVKITEDASYPTPPPGSLNAIGHLPTPAPGSLQMPPPRLGSIPPTSPAPAIGRVASVPPIDRAPSTPPTERLPSKPPGSIPPTDVQRRPPEPSMSMPAVPRRSGALIAVVVIMDLGLAAAGGALLFKGLQKPPAKPAPKTEVTPAPPPAAAAPSPAAPVVTPIAEEPPKEAAKKAPIIKQPAAKKGPVDPYGLSSEVDRMAAQSAGAFRTCFDRASELQPIHGDVRIAFLVQPDGRVDHTRVAVNTTEAPQLSSCLAATIATWTFAPHSGPAASFERPFNYP